MMSFALLVRGDSEMAIGYIVDDFPCGIQHLDMLTLHSLAKILTLSSCSTKLPWKDTKFLMMFGDSYTTDGMSLSFPICQSWSLRIY